MQDSKGLTVNDVLKHNNALPHSFDSEEDGWTCLVRFINTFADEQRKRSLLEHTIEMINEQVPGFKEAIEKEMGEEKCT